MWCQIKNRLFFTSGPNTCIFLLLFIPRHAVFSLHISQFPNKSVASAHTNGKLRKFFVVIRCFFYSIFNFILFAMVAKTHVFLLIQQFPMLGHSFCYSSILFLYPLSLFTIVCISFSLCRCISIPASYSQWSCMCGCVREKKGNSIKIVQWIE